MSTKNVFVFCGDDCKSEGMTKEQILTAITQAVSTGEIKDIDAGFITTIVESNANKATRFWVGTQAQFNAQKETIPNNTVVIILDDTTIDDMTAAVAEMKEKAEAFENSIAELKGFVLYDGPAVSDAEIPCYNFTEFTRFVAYTKYKEAGVEYAALSTFDSMEYTLTPELNTLIAASNNERLLISYLPSGERAVANTNETFEFVKLVGFKY